MKVIWFNKQKNNYDVNYIPTDYLLMHKVKISINNNYLETIMSLNQYYNYIKGYDLVQNIFKGNTKLIDFVQNNVNNNYKKYKKLVNKVQIL